MSSVIVAFFMGCVSQTDTISTFPSAILYAFFALKIFFFWEYRGYKPLFHRRTFLYILFVLVFIINIVPVFVTNNIDYSNYIGNY